MMLQSQIDAKNYVVMLEETADSFALLLKMDVKLAAESKDVTSQNQKVKNAANVLAKVKENLQDVDTAQFSAKLPQNQEANDVAKNSAERLNVDMVHCFAGVQDHAQSIKKDAVVAWQEKCVVALAQFTAVYVLNQHRNQEFVVKH